jgi:hypothetical protein
MARVKYSAFVDSIDGSVGGTTFQKNRYGFSARRKPNAAKPNSPKQITSKASMAYIQTSWIALSDANRANWNTYASTYPRSPKHNSSSTLNGFNYFVFYHLLKNLRQAAITTNPSGAQQTLSFGNPEIGEADPILEWLSDIVVSGGTWIALLFMSRPISESSYIRPNILRFVIGDIVTASPSIEIQDEYSALFGSIPLAGDFVAMQEVFVNQANGQVFRGSLQRVTIT